jgi:L-threonylcarbamoyladenylate synthase
VKTERLRARTAISAAASLPRAAALIRAGGLVAFPTETVYGLGANALDPIAVARIFEAKGRPTFDPLIVHIADRDALPLVFDAAALADPRLTLLADAFWPGPLTIVATAANTIPGLVRAGLPRVGVRIPRHSVARDLIRATGTPIAAPSANLFGRISPTRPEHVLDQLDGRIDAILVGEASEVGIESTVVGLTPGSPAELLRPGGVSREAIAEVLKAHGGIVDVTASATAAADGEALAAPGMSAAHYAPRTPLAIAALADVAALLAALPAGASLSLLAADETKLAAMRDAVEEFNAERGSALRIVAALALTPHHDPTAAAAALFDVLHRLDASGSALIIAAPYPDEGLGRAIADRLRRAAAATPLPAVKERT